MSCREQVKFQWDDDDEVRFIPDQQQCADRHSDTLSWLRANQSLLFLLNAADLAEKQQMAIL
jgi:hypothetical protein